MIIRKETHVDYTNNNTRLSISMFEADIYFNKTGVEVTGISMEELLELKEILNSLEEKDIRLMEEE